MQNCELMKNPKTIFCCILIIGILLLIISLKIPKYTDENKYQELLEMYYQNKITKETYYREVNQITTPKTSITDIGNGIVSFSLFVFLFLLKSKVKRWKDLKNLKTQNKLGMFITSNIAWLFLIPGTYIYYCYRGGRGDYPPFADSIGIPIMQQTFLVLFMLVPLNLFLLISLYKSELPTLLFMRPSINKKQLIFWELFFDIFLLLNVIFLILFIVDGDHISVIISMYFIYSLLSLRAGKLNYLNNKITTNSFQKT